MSLKLYIDFMKNKCLFKNLLVKNSVPISESPTAPHGCYVEALKTKQCQWRPHPVVAQIGLQVFRAWESSFTWKGKRVGSERTWMLLKASTSQKSTVISWKRIWMHFLLNIKCYLTRIFFNILIYIFILINSTKLKIIE